MVGRITLPLSKQHSDDTQDVEDSQHPPSYSDPDPSRLSPRFGETMTTTVTTTTQTTTQTTTHFFSFPLWRRRAGPPMSTSMSEGGPIPSHVNAGEDGRIVRTSSYNINVNKDLPAVPLNDSHAYCHSQPLNSSAIIHPIPLNIDAREQGAAIGSRPTSRKSTLALHTQPARALAHAALGLGLPHVMPLASASSSQVDLTAIPRSNFETLSTSVKPNPIQRPRSFSRTHIDTEGERPSLGEVEARQRNPKKSATLSIMREADNSGSSRKGKSREQGGQQELPEGKLLTRRASFWNRRRVQSLKSPTDLSTIQSTLQYPVPALPSLKPVSPMFHDKELHSSPDPAPYTPLFRSSSQLRRRHSERSASLSTSRLSPLDVEFVSDPPSIPKRSPFRPSTFSRENFFPDSPIIGNDSGTPESLPTSQPTDPLISTSLATSPLIRSSPISGGIRPRSMTNPPNLLHRLSMGIFTSSTPSSPISSPTISTKIFDDWALSSSPRNSVSLTKNSSFSKSTLEIPKPREDEESPELFISRLEEAVSKAEIANILAGSSDSFYTRALQAYIDRFDFANDPLDIALRKLLMDVGLPKETQQIDRVMEAFATRYSKSNPGLFVSDDHPYILAFSLIMLHTDAFNKSNKRKMTKADYIKNTKLVGVSAEVLDCFFDNITFAPFIFIEDPVDVNGQRGLMQGGISTRSSPSLGQAPTNTNSNNLNLMGRSNKIDPYYLITWNLLGTLRVDVQSHIPLRNPFSYQGTAGSWNESELRRSFARADIIEVDTAESRRMSTLPLFSLTVGTTPGPMHNNGFVGLPYVSEADGNLLDISTLRVTKVGLLNRKDELSEGGKRASSRKWRESSVVLTGSQLLFFRDSRLALDLVAQAQSTHKNLTSSLVSLFRPDELLSVKDAIAVHDAFYSKHEYVLRLVLPTGRQFLLQAESEVQRNEWIAHINYASTFKTAGIRMRSVSSAEEPRPDVVPYSEESFAITSQENDGYSDAVDDNTSNGSSPNAGVTSLGIQHPPVAIDSLASRLRILRSKVHDLEAKMETSRSQLDADIRLVRNLAVLTPFQRSTRSRLQGAVVGLGGNIRRLRLEVVKLACYRDVLAADLASCERELRHSQKASPSSQTALPGYEIGIPRMTLSVHDDDPTREGSLNSLSRSDNTDITNSRPSSSICESFHSALDFSSDWSLAGRLSACSNAVALQDSVLDCPPAAPRTEPNSGSTLKITSRRRPTTAPADSSGRRSSVSSPLAKSSEDVVGGSPLRDHPFVDAQRVKAERENGDEQAEEWNKTRAAKRVSLVKVPLNLMVASRQNGWRDDTYRVDESNMREPGLSMLQN